VPSIRCQSGKLFLEQIKKPDFLKLTFYISALCLSQLFFYVGGCVDLDIQIEMMRDFKWKGRQAALLHYALNMWYNVPVSFRKLLICWKI